ncbi:MAG: hypothetical protein ABIL09_16620 [Gemmatimonadota bacterium]
MSAPVAGRIRQAGPRFYALFALWLGAFALAFEAARAALVHAFMYPAVVCTAVALQAMGIPAALGDLQVSAGTCLLAVGDVVYRVTFECTGIFALFMCLSAILAFPARRRQRAQGVLAALPAFFCYSVARMVVLGIVARVAPEQIQLFHLYVMVLVNLGFVLALWLYWLSRAVPEAAR